MGMSSETLVDVGERSVDAASAEGVEGRRDEVEEKVVVDVMGVGGEGEEDMVEDTAGAALLDRFRLTGGESGGRMALILLILIIPDA